MAVNYGRERQTPAHVNPGAPAANTYGVGGAFRSLAQKAKNPGVAAAARAFIAEQNRGVKQRYNQR